MTGSSNHKHDPERDDAGRSEHDRLLDDLQRSAPAPHPGFAAELETRLVAMVQTQSKTRGRPNPMQTTYALSSRQDTQTNTRRLTIPVTMAAAVLALIVAGALIIAYSMQPSPEGNSAAAPILQQDATSTPPPTATGEVQISPIPNVGNPTLVPTSTGVVLPSPIAIVTATPVPTVTPPEPGSQEPFVPTGMRRVVVALVDIPANTVLEADMLAVTFWPDDAAPPAVFSSIEMVEGLAFDEPIAQWQPLLLSELVTEQIDPESDDLVAVSMTIAGIPRMSGDIAPFGFLLGRYDADGEAPQPAPEGFANVQIVGTLLDMAGSNDEAGRSLLVIRSNSDNVFGFPVVALAAGNVPADIEFLGGANAPEFERPIVLLMRREDAQTLLDNPTGEFVILATGDA
jgi:hypothetical protein